MAAFPTPPGTVLAASTPKVGSPSVLVAVPVGSNYVLAGSAVPTTGQIWPRGQG
jgi:hypothetical protein